MDKTISIGIGTLPELAEKRIRSHRYEDSVEIIELEGRMLNGEKIPDISIRLKLDEMNIIVIMAGTAYFEVNSQEYELGPYTTMHLIGVKILRNVRFSEDFKGYHLMVSKNFYDEVFKEGKHLTPHTAMYKTHFPCDDINPDEARLLEECIMNIIWTIGRTDHIWHRKMVETSVRTFFLETGNMIISKTPIVEDRRLSNFDILFFRFMQLVNDNSKDRKSVQFYADKLCLSPDYLAHAIKTFSRKPISWWINDSLVMQAKTYLMDNSLTIQQIVEKMNFADQSSFGRFFKKNTGKTPAEYRKLLK